MDRSALDTQVLDSPEIFAGELQRVEQEIVASLAGLRPPFSQLVQQQMRRGEPLLCGAFFRAAGMGAEA